MTSWGHDSVVTRGRRQFLRAASGATLALPLLPSLLAPREAAAQTAASRKCFAFFCLPHGAVAQLPLYPSAAMLTEQTMYAGHTIRRGSLAPTVVNGETRLSEALRAPSTTLTPGLLAKMNLLRGVDYPFYVTHGYGHALGNYFDLVQGGSLSRTEPLENWLAPTIDQIMAYSPSFYGSATGVRERAMVLGEMSWNFSNPVARTGTLQRLNSSANTNVELFDKVFGTTTTGSTGTSTAEPLAIDRVVESYRRLRQSGRLSALDAQRLDDHVQRLFELQRKLAQSVPAMPVGQRPTSSSATVRSVSGYPIRPDLQAQNWRLWTDVAAAAFASGASRIFTVFMPDTFSDTPRDWHVTAHEAEGGREPARLFVAAQQFFFANVLVDFARKLDAISAPAGGTLLDQSLIAMSHESGSVSHMGFGHPIITFGSAGGFLRTGQYCDYRNLGKVIPLDTGIIEERWHGLTWSQWLGTVLQAMGVPPSEYAGLNGGAGYPGRRTEIAAGDQGHPDPYPNSVWSAAGEVLPWLNA